MTPKPRRQTATLYLRLSDARDDASTSISRQRADLTAYAESHGLRIVAELVDDGVSGRSSREKAQEALQTLRDGDSAALLVWKFDRWSRQGLGAVADLIDVLDKRPGALFVALQDGLNSDQPAWRIIASVLAEVARMEAESTSLRVSSAIDHMRHGGRWHGGRPPVGYVSAPNPTGPGRVLVPDPVAVEHLTDAARRVVAGESLYAVTQRLNASPCRPPAAEEWNHQTLRRAFMGTAIVGRVSARVPGSERAERRFDVLRDESGNARQVWEPVIPVDLWRQVRDVLQARNDASPLAGRQRKPSKGARLLSGLLICAECGGPLYTAVVASGAAYRCSNRSRGKTCPGVTVTAAGLEDWVIDRTLRAFGRMPVVQPVSYELPAAELAEAREALAEISARLGDAGLTDDDEARLESQGRALRRRVRELSADRPPAEVRMEATGETVADVWATADTERRRELLAASIDHIAVSKGLPGSRRFNPDRFEVFLRPSFDELGYDVA